MRQREKKRKERDIYNGVRIERMKKRYKKIKKRKNTKEKGGK